MVTFCQSSLFKKIPKWQVGTIHANIEQLNSKLAEAQEAKQDLLAIKHKLEQVEYETQSGGIIMDILLSSIFLQEVNHKILPCVGQERIDFVRINPSLC